MKDLTGLKTETALQRMLREEGVQGQVLYTSAPVNNSKKRRTEDVYDGPREERVVARRGDTLITAGFRTGLPRKAENEDE